MRNDSIRLQISTSTQVTLHIVALALTVSEISMFQMFDRENFDHGYRLPYLQ